MDTASEVDRHHVGSAEWFDASAAAGRVSSDHMAQEERQGFADVGRHAPIALRPSLGIAFVRFESEHLTGAGVKPVDLNVEEYVSANASARSNDSRQFASSLS